MRARSGDNFVDKIGVGIVKNYDIAFNKKSADGTVKANIVESDGTYTYGMIYEIDHEGFKSLSKLEKGYNVVKQKVYDTEKGHVYETSVFISGSIDNSLSPSQAYANQIIEAHKKENFPEEYINAVLCKIVQ